jgi:hypothetical protein
MYTAYKRQTKRRVFFRFVVVVIPLLLIMISVIWFLFFRDQSSESTNFSKVGAEIAVVKPETKDFTNEYFKITLPASWESLGKKNPFIDQVYYEYQSKLKNYDNRWLRVYVDVYPPHFAINRVLPVSVKDNRVAVDSNDGVSDECWTFTGAPLGSNDSAAGQTWSAKWKSISFTCDMNKNRNYTGAASEIEGYGLALVNKDGQKHKYFFVYIDSNVRPDYGIFEDSLRTFEVK